ncbi:MAG TPA: SET domain-containing protein [Ignavibacteriaceae bacterium]|nr:SET domain-containing protein [Ignavibacteriaceae bacterium]
MHTVDENIENYILVKTSQLHGNGIFTSIYIPAHTRILKISGEVITGNECERREEEENNVYIFWNGDDCYIDTALTDKIKYINHRCDYNCDVVEGEDNSLYLISSRDIQPGEELTIDYGYDEIYNYCSCVSCDNK